MSGALLSACAGEQSAFELKTEPADFWGAVAADEPRAALVGRDVLRQGGSAADAATAMFFAMTATYPMAAGLGGGGYCLAYSRKQNKAEMVDFLPRPPRAGGEVPVPGALRGFAALQGRYGKLRWSATLAPAEQIARFGAPMSRAAIRAFDDLDPEIVVQPATARFFRGGQLIPEGESIRQPDLGETLGLLRAQGALEFYTGSLAPRIVEGAAEAGGKLTLDDLREYAPEWRPAMLIENGSVTIGLPPTPSGEIFRRIWQGSVSSGIRFLTSPSLDRARLPQALGDGFEAPPGERGRGASSASASFSAIDYEGLAVACVVSLQRPFGVARHAGETGILLGAMAGREENELPYLSTVVAFNTTNKQAFLAAAATGGAAAPAALAQVAASLLGDSRPFELALADLRAIRYGKAVPLEAEKGFQGAQAVEAKQPIGRVTAVHCGDGVPRAPGTCRAGADPRGFGFGTLSGQ